MGYRHLKGTYLRVLWPLWHGSLIALIFWFTYEIRLVTDLIPGLQLRIPPIDTWELLIFALLSVVIYIGIGFFVWSYRFQFSLERDRNAHLKQRFFRLVAMTFVAYFGHGFLFVSWISRFILLWTAILSGIVVSLWDWWYAEWLRAIEMKSPISVLCVYQNDAQLQNVQAKRQHFYDIEYRKEAEWRDMDYDSYAFVIVLGEYSQQKLQREFDKIRLANHTMYHIADEHFLENVVYSPATLWGMNGFRYTPTRLSEWMRLVKRVVDVFGSFFWWLLLSPLLLVVSLVIALTSKGPVLYRQKRVGRNGEIFVINKFRTMYTHLSVGDWYGWEDAWKLKKELMESDANVRKGELQKIENDPRVTPIGRFLRKTSLDELPSLRNVLIGEMSLVGPRPHEWFEVERYKSRQRRLLSMKPWITWYAQINGRDALTFDDEANFDLYYMQRWSIRFDLYVLVMTVWVVLKWR